MKKLTKFFPGSLFLFSVVFAQEPAEIQLIPRAGSKFENLVNITVPEMVPVIIQVIFVVATLVALIFLVVGGIKWITAGGDKAATESARGTITSAIVGLVIVLASYAIIRLIELFFDIKILTLEIPPITTQPY